MLNLQLKYKPYTLDCRGYHLEIGSKTLIMGILNVTPDSFSDGGDHNEVDGAIAHALQMIAEGVDIIDVGGESTRPGFAEVSAEEEMRRVIPVIEALVAHPEINVPISIDTYKAVVAEAALQAGAHMINDVWGLQREPEIGTVAAKYGAPVIAMHNQKGTEYNQDIILEMIAFFENTILIAQEAGIPESHLFLDPGIGFGKTVEQNIEVMGRLTELHCLGYPILLGTSRKSMIGKILDLPPKERVEGTVATNVIGVMQGIEIVRVHDVLAHVRAIKVTDSIVRRR